MMQQKILSINDQHTLSESFDRAYANIIQDYLDNNNKGKAIKTFRVKCRMLITEIDETIQHVNFCSMGNIDLQDLISDIKKSINEPPLSKPVIVSSMAGHDVKAYATA